MNIIPLSYTLTAPFRFTSAASAYTASSAVLLMIATPVFAVDTLIPIPARMPVITGVVYAIFY